MFSLFLMIVLYLLSFLILRNDNFLSRFSFENYDERMFFIGVIVCVTTYLLQNKFGQIEDAHSISAGLDYPGIGPEHSWLNDIGRVKYLTATDKDSLKAFQLCSKLEGIIPALEPSHALLITGKFAKKMKKGVLIMNMCGRGDKDLPSVLPLIEKSLKNE